jgi:hypothetical protein
MPPKHRPSPAIPSAMEYLVRPWWLPVLLFWVATLGATYVVWLLPR